MIRTSLYVWVKNLILPFIGRTKQRQACIVTILKSFSLLICWSSLVGLDNKNKNYCPGRLRSDVATIARGRLSLFEGIVTEEFDLAVGAKFISCNGSIM